MNANRGASSVSYKQPTKQAVREEALRHAVDLLTSRRESCALVRKGYISSILAKMSDPKEHSDYHRAALACSTEDIDSWENFRAASIGKKDASDVTVAYLSGPEPTNDIEVLINLGVRPENIWAFESNEDVFKEALADIEASRLRGIKLMNVSIDDYFRSTPRRFDLIYFDACGPFPSHDQKTVRTLVNIFRYSALTPIGVLITNFSAPDISKVEVKENYSHLVASYLYPKPFLDSFDNPSHTITDGAEEHGYVLRPCDTDDPGECIDFVGVVKNNFLNYYGSFITRHIGDIASILAPSMRLLSSPIQSEIVTDYALAASEAFKLVSYTEDDWEDTYDAELRDESSSSENVVALGAVEASLEAGYVNADWNGDALSSPSLYSLLYTLARCGLAGAHLEVEPIPAHVKKFSKLWSNQLSGTPNEKPSALDAVLCFYALRHDDTFWAPSLKRLAAFDYVRSMRFLCDVPTRELALYPAFAQAAYPAHNNVAETRRYSYIAEGKKATMFLDVLPFDECRYVYDWLATSPLIEGDWLDESRQLTFRCALDGIAKNDRWYRSDFLYGCHVVGIDGDAFEPPMYMLRKHVSLVEPEKAMNDS